MTTRQQAVDRLKAVHHEVRGKVRKAVTGDENMKVRSHLRDQLNRSAERITNKTREVQAELIKNARETRTKITQKARRAVTGDEHKRISDMLKEPVFVRTFDKMSFMLGVAVLCGTEFWILVFPHLFEVWYLCVFGIFWLLRVWFYHRAHLQYFLWDFCYFANLLTCLLIGYGYIVKWYGAQLMPPQWELSLKQAVFILGQGPLLWAIVIWRNSLVFHSFDKVTSVFIHLLPALQLHCSRFTTVPNSTTSYCNTATDNTTSACSLHWPTSFLLPMGLYILWQFVYVIKVDIMDASKFTADPTLTNSTRWIVGDKRNAFRNGTVAVCKKLGIMKRDEELNSEEWKTKFIFMGTQLIYTMLTILPSYLCYYYYAWSVGMLVFATSMSVWNGANYYIEVFSKRYVRQFVEESKKREEQGATNSHHDSVVTEAENNHMDHSEEKLADDATKKTQ